MKTRTVIAFAALLVAKTIVPSVEAASIRKEVMINAKPEFIWAALRDFGNVHKRIVPGFVVDCRLDGDARIVTFANGNVVREALVDMDDKSRRLVYSVIGGKFTTHSASVQVFPDGASGSRVVWITDELPNDLAGYVNAQMTEACGVMKRTLERSGAN